MVVENLFSERLGLQQSYHCGGSEDNPKFFRFCEGDTRRVHRAREAFNRFKGKINPVDPIPEGYELEYMIFRMCKSTGQSQEYVEKHHSIEDITIWFLFEMRVDYERRKQNEE